MLDEELRFIYSVLVKRTRFNELWKCKTDISTKIARKTIGLWSIVVFHVVKYIQNNGCLWAQISFLFQAQPFTALQLSAGECYFVRQYHGSINPEVSAPCCTMVDSRHSVYNLHWLNEYSNVLTEVRTKMPYNDKTMQLGLCSNSVSFMIWMHNVWRTGRHHSRNVAEYFLFFTLIYFKQIWKSINSHLKFS